MAVEKDVSMVVRWAVSWGAMRVAWMGASTAGYSVACLVVCSAASWGATWVAWKDTLMAVMTVVH